MLDRIPTLDCLVPDLPVFHTAHATYRTATFDRMVRSKLNVRRKESGNLDELAALIASQGLLQNLVGYEQLLAGQTTGIVEIVAGGRRLLALGMLIASGVLPLDFQIPYLLVPVEEAIAISLAENMGREPMHPADVFDAMLELSVRGVATEDIGLAFGVDAATVRRRLKLANVSPRLVELYRADKINYEQMAALAVSDDHTAQERAWDSLDSWSRQPHTIRRLLTAQQIDVQTDRVARFVGVKTFKKAGGTLVRDVFTAESAGYISDAALLEQLAAHKLAKTAKGLDQRAFAWIEVRARIDQSELSAYARARTEKRAPTEQERARLEAIERELDDIEARLAAADEVEPGDEDVDAQADAEALNKTESMLLEERTALQAKLVVTVAADQPLAGALVTIDGDGNPVTLTGLIRPADKVKMAKLEVATPTSNATKTRAPHSERLTRILSGHRTAALQAELASKPDVALAVLAYTLLRQFLHMRGRANDAIHISLSQPSLPEEAQGGVAWTAFLARRTALQAQLVQTVEDGTLLEWLLVQPQSTLLELLAVCTASAIDTMQDRDLPSPSYQQLANALGLDMRNWWQATQANYFGHVAKARMIEVVTEAVSMQAAVPLEKMQRQAAAAAAERAVADTGWLPELMRTTC